MSVGYHPAVQFETFPLSLPISRNPRWHPHHRCAPRQTASGTRTQATITAQNSMEPEAFPQCRAQLSFLQIAAAHPGDLSPPLCQPAGCGASSGAGLGTAPVPRKKPKCAPQPLPSTFPLDFRLIPVKHNYSKWPVLAAGVTSAVFMAGERSLTYPSARFAGRDGGASHG